MKSKELTAAVIAAALAGGFAPGAGTPRPSRRSSSKGAYDLTRGEVIQMGAKVAFLDRVLAAYGPDAAEPRTKFRAATQDAIRRIWAAEGDPAHLTVDTRAGDAFYAAIESLAPRDDTQRSLKA
jgi:hypothetical protein